MIEPNTTPIDPPEAPALEPAPEALRWWQHQRAWLDDKSRFRIALKARQIGWSTVLAAEALGSAVSGDCTVVVAASERQAHELLRKVKSLLPLVTATANGSISIVRESSDTVELSAGGRIVALPASASTVQGYTGHIILDEFAWAGNQDDLWSALMPTVTSNARFRASVVSTPRARGDRFHKLWTECDPTIWSKHCCTITDAIAGGAPYDAETLRAGIADEMVWRSMYCCEFIDEQYALLPYTLLQSCVDDALPYRASLPELSKIQNLFVGIDIGRLHDLTVFSFLELLPDEVICRGLIEMKGESFERQEDILGRIMSLPNVRRCVVDASGLGMQLAERARRKYGDRVIPVAITMQLKEKMAGKMRRVFELGQIAIPNDTTLLGDLHSVERSITPSGNVQYRAQRGKRGHADRFMSLALALLGCDRFIGRRPAPPSPVLRILPRPLPSQQHRDSREKMQDLSNRHYGF